MNYEEFINLIDNEETGIAKGYSNSYLRQLWFSKEKYQDLFARDLKMFEEIQAGLLNIAEPREGDWVEYEDGKFARISSLHGGPTFQLSNKIGVYVSQSGCSEARGCTWDSDLDHIERSRLTTENLIPTGDVKKALCWTFSEGSAGANRGVWFEINFKVWKLNR